MFFWLWSNTAFAAKTAHILIIANSNDNSFQDAILGFENQLSANANIKFTLLTLVDAMSSGGKEIAMLKPNLIFALGGETIKWVSLEIPGIPIVTTMILKGDIFKNSNNITGISLDYNLKTQFHWLKKFFPQKKEVAILYNPKANTSTVEIAKGVSKQEGFNLIAIPVESPKKLPFALEQLANNIEILFSIPDDTVLSVNTAKEVLLASFSNKVPLIGLSDNWVKSGAFYALSWDYEDLGSQCAVLAKKILAGTAVKSLPPEHPRKVAYTINAKIAEHMNMDIPDELLKTAKIVYN
jgi:putative tryptophan/tyrosine transport system substrate-binding protein